MPIVRAARQYMGQARADHRCTLRKVATASGGRAQPGIGGGPVRVPTSVAGETPPRDPSPKTARRFAPAPARATPPAPPPPPPPPTPPRPNTRPPPSSPPLTHPPP